MKLSDLKGEYREQVERQLAPAADTHPPVGESLAGEIVARVCEQPCERMNKLEAAYARRLDLGVHMQELAGWLYGAIKLRLAGRTWYTPDFVVFAKAGQIEFHETKGFMRDDANVKLKVAAEMYPWFRWFLVRRIKGAWMVAPVGRT